jgi:hypothetical protein
MQGNMVGSSVENTLWGVLPVGKVGILPCISLLATEHAHRPVNNVVRNKRWSHPQKTHKSESYPDQDQHCDSLCTFDILCQFDGKGTYK